MDAESESCEFCQIAKGENSSVEMVCEGREWVAFFPLNPATPGHTLVIPRAHIPDFWALEPELARQVSVGVLQVGQAITEALHPDGMNLISSAGQVAEQSVFHLHLHVVPRWKRDGFGRIWPVGERFEDSELGDVAGRIREECNRSEGRMRDG
jgi:histidine triad (HIT) family protein